MTSLNNSLATLAVASLASATLSFSAISEAEGKSKSLRKHEIVSLFPGVFVGVVDGSWKIKVVANRNGKLKGWVLGTSDTGVWRVRGSKFCVKWHNWTKGEEKCSHIIRKGKWLHTSSGKRLKLRKV